MGKIKVLQLTAVSRNCGVWDLSELVIFETKFQFGVLTFLHKLR
jgi:hypothetical protein